MNVPSADPVPGLVEHLFRREAGRLLAALVRVFGSEHFGLAEDVVQHALLRALQRWPYDGIPDDPKAWLLQVARRRALDELRRRTRWRRREAALVAALEPEPLAPASVEAGPSDDQLRLAFACCHPALPRDARVALTLKAVCGFGVSEIARALLAREATVAQRLVRARRLLRSQAVSLELPPPAGLAERLDAVLEVIYLLFNEGYASRSGETLLREDLCREALRLATRLAGFPPTALPACHALAALLSFQASRLPARLDGAGDLVLLGDQDRGAWDRGLVGRGFAHLERAAAGAEVTRYHLQAEIAACHAIASGDADTNWPRIVSLYDELLALDPSPVVALNRAVAVGRVRGPAAGLAALPPADSERLAGYSLFPAVRARLLEACGRHAEAAADYRQALELPSSPPERRLLRDRLRRCTARHHRAR